MIVTFTGSNRFLSNFYPSPITVRGLQCATVEHAYQMMKFVDPAHQALIVLQPTAAAAKREARKLPLRPDWVRNRLQVMGVLLRKKFLIPKLRQSLIATGTVQLIEGNYWNDTYWGVCRGVGSNYLGKLLMAVRAEIDDDEEQLAWVKLSEESLAHWADENPYDES